MKKRIISLMIIVAICFCSISITEVAKAKPTYDVRLSKKRDPNTVLNAYTKKLVFKKNKIIVCGRIMIVKNGEDYKALPYKKWVFKLNKKTKYYEYAQNIKKVKKKKLFKLFKKLYKQNVGIGMIIVKKKGKVVSVSLAS